MIYAKKDESNIIKFIDAIDELKDFFHWKINVEDENQLMNSIKMSEFAILFKTNPQDYNELESEINYAKSERKMIFTILLNSPSKSRNMKTIEINDPINTDANRNALNYFKIFLPRILAPMKMNSCCYCIRIEATKSFPINENKNILKIISNEEVLIRSDFNDLSLVNFKSNSVTNKIEIRQGLEWKFEWIDHLKKLILLVMKDTIWPQRIELIDIRNNVREKFYTRFLISSILYDRFNQNTYFFNDKTHVYFYDRNLKYKKQKALELEPNLSNRTLDKNYFYMWANGNCFFTVFDLNLNFLFEHHTSSNVARILTDPKSSDILFIGCASGIQVISTNGFQSLGFIETYPRLEMVLNSRLMLTDLDRNAFIYKFELKKCNHVNDSTFICQINPLRPPHLYREPCTLPCGISGCIDCIHENFNIYSQRYVCKCKEVHKLSHNALKQDEKLIGMMDENLEGLCKNMLKIGSNTLNLKGTYVFLLI